MLYLQYFLSYLIIVPTAMLCLMPMRNQLRFGLRRTLLVEIPGLLLLAAGAAWLNMVFPLGENDLLFPLLAICFAGYRWSVKAPLFKVLGVFSVALGLLSVLSNLSQCIDALLGLSFSEKTDMLQSSAIFLCLGCVFVLLLANAFLRYGIRVVDQPMPRRSWVIITALSLALFVCNLLLRPVHDDIYYDRGQMMLQTAAYGTMLVIWGLQTAAFYVTIWDTKIAMEAREQSRLLEMQMNQFDSQQRYIKTSERTRHDFRHSIRTLYELYEAGDYHTLGQYLKQYVAELPVKEITTYTGNTALNALLNYIAHICQQHQIAFQVKVTLPDVLPLSDVELCGMVGNILENAVIACKRAEERKIQLTILVEGGVQLYIVAVNSFDGYVRERNGTYQSTNRKGEGIGLSSVTATAEKYGGVAQFYHEGKQFYSNIAIPLAEDELSDNVKTVENKGSSGKMGGVKRRK